MRNNTVYFYSGQYLKHCHWSKDQGNIFADNNSDINNYTAWSDDNSKIIILKKGTSKAANIKKKLLKNINVSTPKLHLERILVTIKRMQKDK